MLVKVRAKWRAVRRKVELVGVLPTLRLIAGEVTSAIRGREYRLYHFDLTAGEEGRPDADMVFERYRELSEIDPSRRSEITSYASEAFLKVANDRFSKGWTLAVAIREGTVAGGAWTLEDASEFHTTPDEPFGKADVAIVDCWTIPEHRGRRVFPSLLRFIVEESRREGMKRALIEVEEQNIPSIKGIERAGFQRAETAG